MSRDTNRWAHRGQVRAHVATMWPLSQGELLARLETALDALVSDPAALITGEPALLGRQRQGETAGGHLRTAQL